MFLVSAHLFHLFLNNWFIVGFAVITFLFIALSTFCRLRCSQNKIRIYTYKCIKVLCTYGFIHQAADTYVDQLQSYRPEILYPNLSMTPPPKKKQKNKKKKTTTEILKNILEVNLFQRQIQIRRCTKNHNSTCMGSPHDVSTLYLWSCDMPQNVSCPVSGGNIKVKRIVFILIVKHSLHGGHMPKLTEICEQLLKF